MKIKNLAIRIRNKILRMVRTNYLAGGLTRVPSVPQSAISDLFIWRKNQDWRTFFELLDINGLIDANHPVTGNDQATFVFYDQNGKELLQKSLPTGTKGRQTIDISSLLPETVTAGESGTYACFHKNIAEKVQATGSFIAERGYSGYEWKKLGARGYVHGNLDAIARSPKGFELLGNSGSKKRLYKLQHELTGPATYEFALVNPTEKDQKIEFLTKNVQNGQMLTESFFLTPRASCIKKVIVPAGTVMRLDVKSNIYMARPVVFRLAEHSMDVFHG